MEESSSIHSVPGLFQVRQSSGEAYQSEDYTKVNVALWDLYVNKERVKNYEAWMVSVLKKNNCKTVLDAAAGTGVDSHMLLRNGFKVTSCDLSQHMLDVAEEERKLHVGDKDWEDWKLKVANWVNLVDDVGEGENSYDAIVCIGNSFVCLVDHTADFTYAKQALDNFRRLLKPGGILIVDHRNYDKMLLGESFSNQNVYYASWPNSTSYEFKKNDAGRISHVHLEIKLKIPTDVVEEYLKKKGYDSIEGVKKTGEKVGQVVMHFFQYPYRLTEFEEYLKEMFGETAKREVYGDFVSLEEIEKQGKKPEFYVHVVKKPASE